MYQPSQIQIELSIQYVMAYEKSPICDPLMQPLCRLTRNAEQPNQLAGHGEYCNKTFVINVVISLLCLQND